MKKSLLAFLLIPVIAAEEAVKNIVVFGDSFSDVGNKQRMTDGPVWSEDLAVGWNASLYSFAFSGAVCDNAMYKTEKDQEFIPSITDQVEMYYNQHLGLPSEETVFIIWVGVNDVYKIFEKDDSPEALETEYKKVVDCIGTNVRNIRRVFQNNKFIVFGIPPLESMPFYANTDLAPSRERAANRLNELLTKDVEKMNKHLQLLELDLVDVHKLLDDVVKEPEMFDLKNAIEPYWEICQGRCEDLIDSYVWWDKTHLTGGVHRLLANSILMAGSLAPQKELDDTVNVQELLEQPNSIYKSPKYKGVKHNNEIKRVIEKMNKEKLDKQTQEDQEHNINEKEQEKTTTKSKSSRPFFYFGVFVTIIVCIGFILFMKSRRRGNHLAALSGLLKNKSSDRGRFMPLRNLDSEA